MRSRTLRPGSRPSASPSRSRSAPSRLRRRRADVTVFAAASLKNALDRDRRRPPGRDRAAGRGLLCRLLGPRPADRAGRAGGPVHLRRPRLDGLPRRRATSSARDPRATSLGNRIVLVAPAGRAAPVDARARARSRRALGGGRLAIAERRDRAGRQIRQGGARKPRPVGRGRGPARRGRERARGARLRRARRGAARHRLRDRRQGRAQSRGRRALPRDEPPADRLPGGAHRRRAGPEARARFLEALRAPRRRRASSPARASRPSTEP